MEQWHQCMPWADATASGQALNKLTSQKLKYVGCTDDTSYDLSRWREKVLQSRLNHLKSVLSTGLKYVILDCLWGHSVNSAAPHQGILVGICMLARPLWLAEDQSDWNVLTIKWGHWLCGQIYFTPTSWLKCATRCASSLNFKSCQENHCTMPLPS